MTDVSGAHSSTGPEVGDVLLDRYRLERELGRGIGGVVYEARDLGDDSQVALKVLATLDASKAGDAVREFRRMRELQHENVVRLLEMHRDDQLAFFTMELIDGRDFVEHVRTGSLPAEAPAGRRTSLPMAFGQPLQEDGVSAFAPLTSKGLERAQSALRQLARGVSALHSHQRIHRDLRPANVRVTNQGRVVVIDFGLAVDMVAPSPEEEATDYLGTAAYMAPEQWETAALDARSDWYAVGVLLFQALTGDLPFTGTAQEVFVRKRTVSPPAPSLLVPWLPDELDALCARLMHPQADRRAGLADIQRVVGP